MPSRSSRIVVAIAVLVCVCSASGLAGVVAVVRAVHARTPAPGAAHEARAYFITRASECEGLLDFLALFERNESRGAVPLDAVYVIGTREDSARVAATARVRELRAEVRRAPAYMNLQRRALGYANAVLVITDARERVVLARGAPSSPAEYIALAELLAHPPLQPGNQHDD